MSLVLIMHDRLDFLGVDIQKCQELAREETLGFLASGRNALHVQVLLGCLRWFADGDQRVVLCAEFNDVVLMRGHLT